MRKKVGSSAIDTRRRRKLIAGALLRPTLTVFALGSAYFLLPWPDAHTGGAFALLIFGGIVVLGVTAWQIKRILDSDVPALQAVEMASVVVPTYLLVVAMTYFAVERADPASFTEPLSRMAALYFSLTVFSTVGFGDIAAQTDLARALVSLQIVCNLVLIGFGVRFVVAAVSWSKEHRVRGSQDTAGVTDEPSE
ncbi:potassium channel family protein [Rhodococcus sp. IEGM 1379]|uniref:potassium channel family protein n=1 Tax=Rhodococcus sp. IEGM 1379 TaxID=3047086 RepID=UPI0024B75819|nr:potassium channel family protein [Rhodococcus sp. IEGM 1379]MDI9918844.1 potassium channel family protein [Rhodococcus sp. IEGM 1379]